jgi:peptide/nickel transport system substrate-binding protein
MKRLLALFTTAGLGLSLAGCGGPPPVNPGGGGPGGAANSTGTEVGGDVEPPSEPGKYGGKLTIATVQDPKTFNYWVSGETSSSDVLGELYDALNNRNAYTLKFETALADLPNISSDGLTYTYTLKEGVKWSDGRPITADDVIFTLGVIMDPKIETIMREGMLIDVVQADGSVKRQPFKYRKVDDRTVEFVLPQKYAPAESIFSFPIAPKHKLEGPYRAGKFNSTWGVSTNPKELISSSAWVISEYVPGQRLIYKRNPNYWRKSADGKQLPYLDTYTLLFVSDLNAASLKFQNGETDALGVPPSIYPEIKKKEADGDYKVIDRGPGWGFAFLGFNMNPTSAVDKNLVSLFQDVRFRKAISHAVDRQRMIDDIYRGFAVPGWSPLSPANKVYYNPNVTQYPYDLEKSKALLAEIGLKDGNGNGFLEYNGKDVKFNILIPSGIEPTTQSATVITNDLKKLGLNAQFSPTDFNDLVRRLDSKPYDWQAVILGFTGGPEPHDGSNIWRSSGPSHQWWPKQTKPATPWEAEIDKLWVEGAQELDLEKRKAIYNRWQEIAADQLPFIYTIVQSQNSALRNRLGNVKPPSTRITLWNTYEIFDRTATRDTP